MKEIKTKPSMLPWPAWVSFLMWASGKRKSYCIRWGQNNGCLLDAGERFSWVLRALLGECWALRCSHEWMKEIQSILPCSSHHAGNSDIGRCSHHNLLKPTQVSGAIRKQVMEIKQTTNQTTLPDTNPVFKPSLPQLLSQGTHKCLMKESADN